MSDPTRGSTLMAAGAIQPDDRVTVTQNMDVEPVSRGATVQQLADFVAVPLDARMDTIEAAQAAGMIGFPDKATMDADLHHPAGQLALVTNDATPANNTTYLKIGAIDAGSWTVSTDRISVLQAALDPLAAILTTKTALNRVRAWRDKFYRMAMWITAGGQVGITNLAATRAAIGALTVSALTITSETIGTWTSSANTSWRFLRRWRDSFGRMSLAHLPDGSIIVSKLKRGNGAAVYPQIDAATANAALALAAAGGTPSAYKQGLLVALPNGRWPGLHPSPPTVVVNGGFAGIGAGNSALTSPVKHAWDAGLWRTLYGQGVAGTTGSPIDMKFQSVNQGAGIITVCGCGIEFDHTGTDLEIVLKNAADSDFRLFVDGKLVQAANYPLSTGDGLYYHVRITFSGSATRRIRWEGGVKSRFGGVMTSGAETIIHPLDTEPPIAVYIGDSYVAGAIGTTYTCGGMIFAASKLLGFNMIVSGLGGTGFVNPGPYQNFIARIGDANVPNAQAVFVGMSQNDETGVGYPGGVFSQQVIHDAVRDYIRAFKAVLPNTPLIIVGPTWYTGFPSLAAYQMRDAGWQSAIEEGAYFVDQLSPNTITGTGYVGHTIGDGNADIYIHTDAHHRSQAGAEYQGRLLASQIRRLIKQELR